MIPVDQTEFSSGDGMQNGNCMSACLASIAHIPIQQVPNFATVYATTGKWLAEFEYFLHTQRLHLVDYFYFRGVEGEWDELLKQSCGIDGYFIVGGDSPRYHGLGHAVVFKDNKMVHDPHPSRAGLLSVRDAMLIERIPVQAA